MIISGHEKIDFLIFTYGFSIFSLAVLLYKLKSYIGKDMKTSIDNIINGKACFTMMVGGVALSFTVNNITSIIGAVVGVLGLFVAIYSTFINRKYIKWQKKCYEEEKEDKNAKKRIK